MPIFLYTNQIFKASENVLKMQWMGKNVKLYVDMKHNFVNNNKTETVEHILILTSILANALTNVYLSHTQGKHAPHLLKDLINSEELINLFGSEMVSFVIVIYYLI